jgi:hypothetical protein
LFWRVTDILDAFLDVSIVVAGRTYTKRIFAVGGVVNVPIWDVLGALHTNPNELLNKSVAGYLLPTDCVLSYEDSIGTASITISLFDAQMPADVLVNGQGALTGQEAQITYDNRYEGGLFFYGSRTIEFLAEQGFFVTNGTANAINYLSFRNITGTVAHAASVASRMLFSPSQAITISGFPNDALAAVSVAHSTFFGAQFVGFSPVFNAFSVTGNSYFSGAILRNASNVVLYYIEFATGYTNNFGRVGYCPFTKTILYANTGVWVNNFLEAPMFFYVFGGVEVVDNETGLTVGWFANNEDGTNITETLVIT